MAQLLCLGPSRHQSGPIGWSVIATTLIWMGYFKAPCNLSPPGREYPAAMGRRIYNEQHRRLPEACPNCRVSGAVGPWSTRPRVCMEGGAQFGVGCAAAPTRAPTEAHWTDARRPRRRAARAVYRHSDGNGNLLATCGERGVSGGQAPQAKARP